MSFFSRVEFDDGCHGGQSPLDQVETPSGAYTETNDSDNEVASASSSSKPMGFRNMNRSTAVGLVLVACAAAIGAAASLLKTSSRFTTIPAGENSLSNNIAALEQRHLQASWCSSHERCAHLEGVCCPTFDGVILGCCDNYSPPTDPQPTGSPPTPAPPSPMTQSTPSRSHQPVRLAKSSQMQKSTKQISIS